MSRRRYRARRLRARDGSFICWGVFTVPEGIVPSMAASFTGPFSWWRARRHASALNRRAAVMSAAGRVKFPSVPLPEPLYEITVSHPDARSRRALVHALRFLLWVTPACAVDYVLATADGGRHSLWLTLAASFAAVAVAVLLVGVRDGGEDAS